MQGVPNVFNYLFPYLTKLLQNEYMIVDIEKNMCILCKNSKYRDALNEMLKCDKDYHQNLLDVLKELGYSTENILFPPLKPIENVNEGLRYLLNLKSDCCNLYRYLKLFNFSTKIAFPLNKILKKEMQHFNLLSKLEESFKDRPYSLTTVVDLVAAYGDLYNSLERLRLSHSNEESESKREVIRDLIKNNDDTLKDLIKLIKSYTKRNLKVHICTETDTLWKISERYDCSLNDISELNSIRNPYDIVPGKILIIPVNEE